MMHSGNVPAQRTEDPQVLGDLVDGLELGEGAAVNDAVRRAQALVRNALQYRTVTDEMLEEARQDRTAEETVGVDPAYHAAAVEAAQADEGARLADDLLATARRNVEEAYAGAEQPPQ